MNTDDDALNQMENKDENLENKFEKRVTNVKIQDLTPPIMPVTISNHQKNMTNSTNVSKGNIEHIFHINRKNIIIFTNVLSSFLLFHDMHTMVHIE